MNLFAKKHRLTEKTDFKEVFQGVLRARSGPFQLMCRKNNTSNARFGFVVPLSVSKKAVRRNKLRRQLRSITQNIIIPSVKGYDCVIRTYPGSMDLSFEEIEKCVVILFEKVGIIHKIK